MDEYGLMLFCWPGRTFIHEYYNFRILPHFIMSNQVTSTEEQQIIN
jgi:hypothetical protein